jgi:glycosyltransferase involved in cell wall biosynthesis
MQVTVVVPTYNQSNFLRATLDSILGQSYRPSAVIVVNDGSTDDTQSVLESYASQISAVTTSNHGVAQARNTGLERVESAYVAFCDSDDVWHRDKLQMQLRRMEYTGYRWCLCGVDLIDEEGRYLGSAWRGSEGWVFERIIQLKPHTLLGGGSGVVVETDLARGVGGFDIGLSTSADWEFYARLSLNAELAFASGPWLSYRLHASGMHLDIDTWQSDMTRAINGFRQRRVVSRSEHRRSLAALDIQIGGELWKRGQPGRSVRTLAASALKSPLQIIKALARRTRGHLKPVAEGPETDL